MVQRLTSLIIMGIQPHRIPRIASPQGTRGGCLCKYIVRRTIVHKVSSRIQESENIIKNVRVESDRKRDRNHTGEELSESL